MVDFKFSSIYLHIIEVNVRKCKLIHAYLTGLQVQTLNDLRLFLRMFTFVVSTLASSATQARTTTSNA